MSARGEPAKASGRTVVVSAVNLVEGGTLTVLRECLAHLRAGLGPQWRVVALVHRRSLAPVDGVDYLEFPRVKASYLRRLWFEYVGCRRLSRELQADLWIALHDLTPVVHAGRQVVYCHNPVPFRRWSWRELRLAPVLIPFALLQGCCTAPAFVAITPSSCSSRGCATSSGRATASSA